MPKFIVFSDSHGMTGNMKKMMELHREADAFFFVGDGIRDFFSLKAYFSQSFEAVRGNCDNSALPETHTVKLLQYAGKRIMLCHGNTFFVNSGLDTLIAAACKNDADIVVFGHTHIVYYNYFSPSRLQEYDIHRDKCLFVLNPGSISLPRDGKPSYGIIEIISNGVISHAARIP